MTPAELIAIGISSVALLVTVGVHVFTGGRGEGQHEAKFEEIRRDIERIDHELTRLRDWRHSVGDRPGFAALVRNNELDQRVQRVERALNGWLEKYGP
jgi:hypothetical protein